MPRGKHQGHVRGSHHYRWNAGRMLSEQGYVKIRVGIGDPLADRNGYAYEHKVVLAAAGIVVTSGAVVHHRNGDRTDNRLENLEVLPRGDHNSLHNKETARNDRGQFRARALR